MHNLPISEIEVSNVIRMAWEDRTSFDEIREKTGFAEAAVIALMRRELKPSSFKLWRKRVSGRVTKHRAKWLARVSGANYLQTGSKRWCGSVELSSLNFLPDSDLVGHEAT